MRLTSIIENWSIYNTSGLESKFEGMLIDYLWFELSDQQDEYLFGVENELDWYLR